MSKFQNIQFKSIDDFFEYLPKQELEIVLALRKIVLNCIPNCTEKLSYNVPYYSKNNRICFIWPSSIPWGKVKKDGVLFGFCYGNLLSDELNYLDKEERKQVFTKTFHHINEIDEDILKTYLFEAAEIDANKKKSNKPI